MQGRQIPVMEHCYSTLGLTDGLAEPVIDDAEPGGNITLKCGANPSKINQYARARVSWYRKEPDGRIRIVTYLSTGYLKDGRYSGTLDNKNGQYHLTIAYLQRNDSAVYFCIARAALLFVPGSITKLVVSESTSPPGPSKRPAEGGKKAPAPLPVTSGGEKGEKAPEAAGPSAPPESARGEKAAEWTTVARRKKKAAARSTGSAKQEVSKPAAAPSGGGSGGVPGKETPSTAPPARQGGKALQKTKHLIPTEGEVRSAAGGELPVAVTRQGTASGSIRGKRKAPARLPTCARKCTRLGLLVGVPGEAKEGPQKRKRLPRCPPSTGTATEGEKAPSPEVVQGSAEAAEPMEEAPAERPKGREEHARAEEALRVDPLPVSKETSDASPERTIEGPAAAEVAEGEQEGPPKEHLPRAPPSSDGDTGPETCVAKEGAAETAPEAEAGSADKADPMQATTAEEPEGEEEPSQEQKLPQASLSCGDGGFGPRAAAEGDEETPPEADVGSVEPAPTMVSEARKGGEEPERAEGGALKADPLPEVQQGQETGPRPSIEGPVPVTKGAREEPPKEQPPVTDAEAGEGPERVYPLSLGEGGEGPERVDPLPSRAEDGPETVPRTSKEGPRAGTRPSGSAAYAEPPSAPPKSRGRAREGRRWCPKGRSPPRSATGPRNRSPTQHRGAGSSHQGGAGGAPERTTAGD
ncbi:UNVERIFIED_CONTAM: hypothetical protein FKN15_010920 [Acipenser sinensis]